MFGKPANEAGAAWPGIVVGLFVAFGGVLYGYDTGTISGILEMVSNVVVLGGAVSRVVSRSTNTPAPDVLEKHV
jgi:hypothetical protein